MAWYQLHGMKIASPGATVHRCIAPTPSTASCNHKIRSEKGLQLTSNCRFRRGLTSASSAVSRWPVVGSSSRLNRPALQSSPAASITSAEIGGSNEKRLAPPLTIASNVLPWLWKPKPRLGNHKKSVRKRPQIHSTADCLCSHPAGTTEITVSVSPESAISRGTSHSSPSPTRDELNSRPARSSAMDSR